VAGLRDYGYVAGQNVVVEFRSLRGGPPHAFPPLAAELARLGVDVIVTSTQPGVRTVMDAGGTTPDRDGRRLD
jgi:putative ABC transport system substrate-binding protein